MERKVSSWNGWGRGIAVLVVGLMSCLSAEASFWAGVLYYKELDDNSVEVTYNSRYTSGSYYEYWHIEIPETVEDDGKTYNVTGVADYAFENCSWLTAVTFPEGLIRIGKYAFKGCNYLKHYDIPGSVETIGDGAFYDHGWVRDLVLADGEKPLMLGYRALNVGNLETLYLGRNIISDSRGGNNLRSGDLMSVKIGDYVTAIEDEAFMYCSNLYEVKIGNGVTRIGDRAFEGCSNLSNISIPAGVTEIGSSAFKYSNIESISIPDGVSTIGDATFEGCKYLSEIVLPAGITSIGNATFKDCNRLAKVTLSGEVTSIGDKAFEGCAVSEFVLPAGLTSIGNATFKDCAQLAKVTLSGEVTSVGDEAFRNCNNLGEINLSEKMTYLGYSAFEGCGKLKTVGSLGEITQISNRTFKQCYALESIDVPPTVSRIGEEAFASCNFADFRILDKKYESRSMFIEEKAFDQCRFDSLYIGRDFTNSLFLPFEFFQNQVTLKTLTIGDGVKYLYEGEFRGCHNLTNLTIGKGLSTLSANAFEGCSSLMEITIPGNIGKLDNSVFKNCTWLSKLRIESGDHGIMFGEDVFSGCQIVELYLDRDIFTDSGVGAFSGHGSLRTLTLGANVKWISKGMFSDTGLSCLTIPETVSLIKEEAFCRCFGLLSVRIENSTTIANNNIGIDKDAFSNCEWLNSFYVGRSIINNSDTGGPIFRYDSSLKSIEFSDDVRHLGADLFSGSMIETMTLPRNLFSIESGLFKDCVHLASITIPDGICYIKTEAFGGCVSLKEINIPNSAYSIETLAFNGCVNLESVRLPSGLKRLNKDVFYKCESLKHVTIADSEEPLLYEDAAFLHNPIETLYMGRSMQPVLEEANRSPFIRGQYLKEVTFSDQVTRIEDHLFESCTNLNNVILPSSVTYIGKRAFSGCKSMESIAIPEGFDSISTRAFSGCSSLANLTLPKSLTRIGEGAFSGCSSLVNLELPKGLTTISDNAFSGCSIQDLRIPGGVTQIGDIAFGYSYFDTVTFEEGEAFCLDPSQPFYKASIRKLVLDRTLGKQGTPCLAFKENSGLESVTITANVQYLGDEAFAGCRWLREVFFKGDLSFGEGVFANCTSLTELPTGIRKIGRRMFEGCTGLTSIVIPETITEIGSQAFKECSDLTSVVIPKTVTGIGWSTFEGCTGLSSVTMPETVTHIGPSAFKGCVGLTSISIPELVRSISDGAFEGCTGLSSVTIPETVTQIESSTFKGCVGLTSISIPEWVRSIGDGAFEGCEMLRTITLPETLKKIGERAFDECNSLLEVDIPASVIEIGHRAFGHCDRLTSVYCRPTTPPAIGTHAFYNYDRLSKQPTVYVPQGTRYKYKYDLDWDYSQEVPLEEMAFSGIEGVWADDAAYNDGVWETERYDAGGRRIADPQRGLNIIRMSDGRVRKEMKK